jgi:hypothetical protein
MTVLDYKTGTLKAIVIIAIILDPVNNLSEVVFYCCTFSEQ